MLRPYIEAGTKFFVARVDVERVTFEDGRAVLSPLRVHYEADTFTLPVRLGLLNSPGTQDLVVHILGRNQRYDVANYENVTIPTNLDVADEVRERFGEFYATLFDATLERHPGAVVTEYAWQAMGCDPCPGPALTPSDIATLGGDVVGASARGAPQLGGPFGGRFGGSPFVLTRLHYRYDADGLDEDLVFRAAEAIVGGREFLNGDTLEHGARPFAHNNFQGRYAIRHPWEGAIACDEPTRGRWGGPPSAGHVNTGQGPTAAARNTAFATRGDMQLPPMLRTSAPEIGVTAGLRTIADVLAGGTAEAQEPGEGAPPPEAPEVEDTPGEAPSGCGSCAVGAERAPPRGLVLGLGLLALCAFGRRREA